MEFASNVAKVAVYRREGGGGDTGISMLRKALGVL